jgi:hypothetical protein
MIPALLTTGLGAIATTVAFRLNRSVQPADERLHPWGAVWALMRILGPMIVLAGVLSAMHASGRVLPRPAPLAVWHTVSVPEFGVEVKLPSTWSLVAGKAQADFVASDPDTGAVLAGVVNAADPDTSLRVAIDRIFEDQRAHFGTVESTSRGVLGLGPLHAQWVDLSFHGQGDSTRIKIIALRRGAKILTLTCNGGERAQNACGAAIHPEIMKP